MPLSAAIEKGICELKHGQISNYGALGLQPQFNIVLIISQAQAEGAGTYRNRRQASDVLKTC